jgi:hypothetical protein
MNKATYLGKLLVLVGCHVYRIKHGFTLGSTFYGEFLKSEVYGFENHLKIALNITSKHPPPPSTLIF